MSTDLRADLERWERAQREHVEAAARAQAQADRLREQIAEAEGKLAAVGCETVEDAQALVDRLHGQAAKALQDARTGLEATQ